MSLFDKYIEAPIQNFDTIDNVDSTLIVIYSTMMNHQDNAMKQGNRFYVESIDSIAHLAHCGRATTTRKINQLIDMGLLVRSWIPNKMNSWRVKPLSNLVADWPRRKSNREEMEDKISLNQNELMNCDFDDDLNSLNQNELMNVQNDSINVQNELMNVQNDSGNSSILTVESNSSSSSYTKEPIKESVLDYLNQEMEKEFQLDESQGF